MRFVVVGYLAYLTWQAFTAKDGGAFAPAPGRALPAWVIFLLGYLMNLLDPKVTLLFLTFLPPFIIPEARGRPANPGARQGPERDRLLREWRGGRAICSARCLAGSQRN